MVKTSHKETIFIHYTSCTSCILVFLLFIGRQAYLISAVKSTWIATPLFYLKTDWGGAGGGTLTETGPGWGEGLQCGPGARLSPAPSAAAAARRLTCSQLSAAPELGGGRRRGCHGCHTERERDAAREDGRLTNIKNSFINTTCCSHY